LGALSGALPDQGQQRRAVLIGLAMVDIQMDH
jgi:hypothetical protein